MRLPGLCALREVESDWWWTSPAMPGDRVAYLAVLTHLRERLGQPRRTALLSVHRRVHPAPPETLLSSRFRILARCRSVRTFNRSHVLHSRLLL
jgi:hypothetical protein